MKTKIWLPNHSSGLGLANLTTALAELGAVGNGPVLRADGAYRVDAVGDTMYLARELENVSAQTYDVLYNPIMGREIMSFVMDIPEGAESDSYDMYDGYAKAEWIDNYESTVGNTDAFKTHVNARCRSFGSHYKYTDQDLAAAAMAGNGRSLDRERAKRARLAHEQFLDDLIAVGDSTRSIPGLLNGCNASPSTSQPIKLTTRAGANTWTGGSVTVADIHKDLTKLAQFPEQASKGNFKANTLLLPLSQKPLLATPFSSLNGQTILSVWLEGQKDITDVKFWWRNDTASAIGGPRAFAYQSGSDVMRFRGSYDYREKPPQVVNRALVVNTTARVKGPEFIYPMAMAAMDLDA